MKIITAILGLSLFGAAAQAEDIGFRLRLGLNDKAPTNWDGSVTVSPGRVVAISGWRFTAADSTDGTNSWQAATRPAVGPRRANNPRRAAQNARPNAPLNDNGVLLSLTGVTADSVVQVKTLQGDFSFKVSEAPYGKILDELDQAVEVERTASAVTLTDGKTDDDYPSAVVAADGTVFTTYTSFTPGLDRDSRAKRWETAPDDLSFLAKAPGGDQLWLRAVDGPRAGDAIAVTETGRDIYKSSVTVDGAGTVWIFWSENTAYKPYPNDPQPNFDIWARSFKDGKLGEPVQISTSSENDIWPVAATDAKGHVWVAWQGARNQIFRIFERHQDDAGWTAERQVSTQSRNSWAPAIAAGSAKAGGRVAIAWDTYEKGDYDVWLREFDTAGKPADARPVANTPEYEARPALTYNPDGSLWIAYELSGESWGKDFGGLVQNKGIPLYRDRQIGLAVLKDGQWQQPAASFENSLPGATPRRRQNNQRAPALEPGGESREAGQEAEVQRNFPHNNLARIVTDAGGHVWIFARSRQNDFQSPLGSVWFNWATYYDGQAWVGPILLPHSDNLLYNFPAVVALGDGSLLVTHSTDHRHDRTLQRTGAGGGNIALNSDNDPYINGLYLSRLKAPGTVASVSLKATTNTPAVNPQPSASTVAELAAVKRVRDYKVNVDGQDLRPVRGEFHRHTEISGDGGNDGALEDMWRYGIDVADFDWLGNGDHDNGAGREYTWWLIQKSTDAFYLGDTFSPEYTYERSVVYPEGHRNVIFGQRGIRTLPRLPITVRDYVGHAPDTQLLYKYLHLFGGVTAAHTSATGMGTDWRDNDPEVEPFVEIYQGCRQNYERPGAPRSPTEDDAIGGWEPKGFINLALLKGYRLGFESSSDHRSTHISYAIVYAKDNSHQEIIKAIKQRHTYAATANILADVRSEADGKEHFLGDEYTAGEAPKLTVKLTGTGPFSKVVIVKDDVEIHTETPNSDQVDFTWTDPSPTPGKTSYYYVRGEQQDGELVWVSPQWIKYQPK
ncbi:MAG TPA: hypothetical protein VG347_23995 [Verrucomicrobiae bacterium]|nr:hypothetical protein [Verrucomicrobiae bacterium]